MDISSRRSCGAAAATTRTFASRRRYAFRDALRRQAERRQLAATALPVAARAAADALRAGADAEKARRAAADAVAAVTAADGDEDGLIVAHAERVFQEHLEVLRRVLTRLADAPAASPTAAPAPAPASTVVAPAPAPALPAVTPAPSAPAALPPPALPSPPKRPSRRRRRRRPREPTLHDAELPRLAKAHGLNTGRIGGGHGLAFGDRQRLKKLLQNGGGAAAVVLAAVADADAADAAAASDGEAADDAADAADENVEADAADAAARLLQHAVLRARPPPCLQVAKLFGAGAAADRLLGRALERGYALSDLRGLRLAAPRLLERVALRGLTSLDLSGVWAGDDVAALKCLRPAAPTLERLYLNAWRGLESLACLGELPRLRVLSLAEVPQLCDGSVSALWDDAPCLEDLCLYGCRPRGRPDASSVDIGSLQRSSR